MSDVRPAGKEVVGIFVSDLHLSAKAPLCRAEKGDEWLEVQIGYLNQLRELRNRSPGAAVVYPGDIFDRWNTSAEIINLALHNLTQGFAVPGQHDLPLHNYEDRHRSAYGTLAVAGKIVDLRPDVMQVTSTMLLQGFPWGAELCPPCANRRDGKLSVAVVHRYLWRIGMGYPGAKEEEHVGQTAPALRGFDAAFFGDNHVGFAHGDVTRSQPQLGNCGGFIRRKSDEKDRKPGALLLHKDGSVSRHLWDTSKDKFIDVDDKVESRLGELDDFVQGLNKIVTKHRDFREAVEQFCQTTKVSTSVRKIVAELLEDPE